MLEIGFFPIYGLMLGVNYADGSNPQFGLDPDQRSIQIMIFVLGIDITWFTDEYGQ